ncbi:MAG: hypothetical protein NWF02_08850 [Candidatus Bathyarchaeota archaeon]|nr:hypothetical protein [Candidatus Bathyarchaeum sp.]
MSGFRKKLSGGDLRSIGKSNEVVQEVFDNPELFAVVFQGTLSEDPLIRMRSADVIEKVSTEHPEYLQPFKTRLINEVSKVEQKEVQWHVAQMFAYIEVTEEERNKIIEILQQYAQSNESKLVVTFSLQTFSRFCPER